MNHHLYLFVILLVTFSVVTRSESLTFADEDTLEALNLVALLDSPTSNATDVAKAVASAAAAMQPIDLPGLSWTTKKVTLDELAASSSVTVAKDLLMDGAGLNRATTLMLQAQSKANIQIAGNLLVDGTSIETLKGVLYLQMGNEGGRVEIGDNKGAPNDLHIQGGVMIRDALTTSKITINNQLFLTANAIYTAGILNLQDQSKMGVLVNNNLKLSRSDISTAKGILYLNFANDGGSVQVGDGDGDANDLLVMGSVAVRDQVRGNNMLVNGKLLITDAGISVPGPINFNVNNEGPAFVNRELQLNKDGVSKTKGDLYLQNGNPDGAVVVGALTGQNNNLVVMGAASVRESVSAKGVVVDSAMLITGDQISRKTGSLFLQSVSKFNVIINRTLTLNQEEVFVADGNPLFLQKSSDGGRVQIGDGDGKPNNLVVHGSAAVRDILMTGVVQVGAELRISNNEIERLAGDIDVQKASPGGLIINANLVLRKDTINSNSNVLQLMAIDTGGMIRMGVANGKPITVDVQGSATIRENVVANRAVIGDNIIVDGKNIWNRVDELRLQAAVQKPVSVNNSLYLSGNQIWRQAGTVFLQHDNDGGDVQIGDDVGKPNNFYVKGDTFVRDNCDVGQSLTAQKATIATNLSVLGSVNVNGELYVQKKALGDTLSMQQQQVNDLKAQLADMADEMKQLRLSLQNLTKMLEK